MFEYDEQKRATNLRKHGIDLLYAALIFERPVLTRIDARKDYDETRFISLGLVEDRAFVVVHTRRGDRTRLISAWLGGQKAYGTYKARFPD